MIKLGTNANVWKVKKKDEYRDESKPEFYALKIVNQPFKQEQLEEVEILKELQDIPGIVKYYYHFYNEEAHLCI